MLFISLGLLHCLISTYWKILLFFSVIYFYFDSIMDREHILYDFNYFVPVKVCFTAQERVWE